MSSPMPPRIDLNNLCYIEVAPTAYDPDYGEILEISLVIRREGHSPLTFTSMCRSFAPIEERLKNEYLASGFHAEYSAGQNLEADEYDKGHPPAFVVEERILQWLTEHAIKPGEVCLAGDEAAFAQRMLEARMPLVAQAFPRAVFDTKSFAAGAMYVRPDATRSPNWPTRTLERCKWYVEQTEVLVARLRMPMPKVTRDDEPTGRAGARRRN